MARIFLRSNHKQTIFIDSVCSAENYLGQQAFMDGHVVSAAAKIAVHSRNYMHLICTKRPQFNKTKSAPGAASSGSCTDTFLGGS